MAELDTNFVDAVLSANMNGKKRVRLTQIAENEYIVEDITEYEKVGSEYGQKEINTLNETVNGKVNKVEVIDDLDTVKAVTEDNVPVGCKAVTKFANDVNQSLTNVNNLKRTYLRLVLPNVAAEAKAVCDYINKNYLMGQITPMYSIEFDAVVANADWFSGVLSTDSNVDSNARTVWGIVQRRSISADNSTLYKYFGSGAGGAGTVSPFKSYDQGYAQGVTDADNRANANSTNYKTGYNNGYNAGKSDGALTGVSGCCIAGWRSIDAYSNNQWVSGWTGVNPNYFTVNGYGIVPKRNFTATVYWQGYNKRDIDFYSNGVMGHRDNGTSMNGVKMNFYAGTQCGFKTNDSGGGSLGAGFIVLN